MLYIIQCLKWIGNFVFLTGRKYHISLDMSIYYNALIHFVSSLFVKADCIACEVIFSKRNKFNKLNIELTSFTMIKKVFKAFILCFTIMDLLHNYLQIFILVFPKKR